MILKSKDLTYEYVKTKPVIKSVSLDIKQGDFVGILGPNGAGKTTLLRLLSGYIKPNQGEVFLREKNIRAHSIKELAKLRSFVPQESHLDFDYSVEEIVWLGRSPYADVWGREKGWQEVEKALRYCQLEEFKKRNARELSGGEWQRVVLARALAQDTEIIFLDEPTHFLDIYHQLHILKKLKELNKQGKTIITVFHDLNLATQFCNQVILMRDGEIAFSGAGDSVLNQENIKKIYNVDVEIINKDNRRAFIFN
ncbi:MAG: ABC transporter ATP-binding protein [Candidatus Margulisbacteria bacterium]|nr:ABC transporter ATP-binding protein [Candidatus Margulisiibacteriota bacterium]